MSTVSKISRVVSALIVAATFTFVPQAAHADTVDGFTYTVDGSSNATVTGCDLTCPTHLVIP
jgi:hypothetical protein